jgi:hypothetical protein
MRIIGAYVLVQLSDQGWDGSHSRMTVGAFVLKQSQKGKCTFYFYTIANIIYKTIHLIVAITKLAPLFVWWRELSFYMLDLL